METAQDLVELVVIHDPVLMGLHQRRDQIGPRRREGVRGIQAAQGHQIERRRDEFAQPRRSLRAIQQRFSVGAHQSVQQCQLART
ncbi:hypothetical protein D3C71_1541210 [compost metagenome]